MRIFVFEFITGGGCLAGKAPPGGSLLSEGRAMLEAVGADLAALPGIDVTCLRDRRLAPWLPAVSETHDVADAAEVAERFNRLAAESEATLVVAPEFDGLLLKYCQKVLAVGGRLLGPPPEFVELAADKHATAEHLFRAGVPAPRGRAIAAGEPWSAKPGQYPAVWKPRFGAGSQGVQLLRSPPPGLSPGEAGRLEPFCPGLAASVAVLCGPSGLFPLPACGQDLSDDGRFSYLGGGLPLEAELAGRAERLARQAVATLPVPHGYVGVDLILGEARDGSLDVVIEINPRLTTSYVGLRIAARQNLAGAMLAVGQGLTPQIDFDLRPLRFDAAGHVWRL